MVFFLSVFLHSNFRVITTGGTTSTVGTHHKKHDVQSMGCNINFNCTASSATVAYITNKSRIASIETTTTVTITTATTNYSTGAVTNTANSTGTKITPVIFSEFLRSLTGPSYPFLHVLSITKKKKTFVNRHNHLIIWTHIV